ncbi:hypothetical protein L596_015005 [Steinernema carpocapsae]|uniref:Uncharacterized protein n=1 Tax=Steinernema carpocapsae TaxID=34508 RepID=A0A4U5NDL4_STECR|nr:hypothetical protein L596_015005 [Steinernema carpocapsae]
MSKRPRFHLSDVAKRCRFKYRDKKSERPLRLRGGWNAGIRGWKTAAWRSEFSPLWNISKIRIPKWPGNGAEWCDDGAMSRFLLAAA